MKRYSILLILASLLFVACNDKSNYSQLMGFTQGTTYNIIYDNPTNFKMEIDSLLAEFDTSLSSYNSSSIISRINRNETDVELDNFFTTVVEASLEISRQTDGAFDITVAPIVKAYGFGLANKDIITDELIDSLREFVHFDLVTIENNRLNKAHPNVSIDVNAVAQGYSVDVVANYLESLGMQNYLVEIGGEVLTKGVNREGANWRVGVDKPIDDTTGVAPHKLQAVVELKNKALATSGNYRKFYIEDGIKYAHTIDPRLGRPVLHNLLSATVIADDCMSADAYATAFMVMGAEEAMEFATNNNLDVYLIIADKEDSYKILQTPGFKEYVAREFE